MDHSFNIGNYIVKYTNNDLILIKNILLILIVLIILFLLFMFFTNSESRKNIKKYISIGFWINLGILFSNIVLGLLIGIILSLIIFI